MTGKPKQSNAPDTDTAAGDEADDLNHPISEARASQSSNHSHEQHERGASAPSGRYRISPPAPTPLSGGLYVAATPIGNLRDITVRALDVLSSADVILAEDTRQTRKLLDAYDIKTPLTPYHDHNAAKRIPALLDRLGEGAVMALVSDAGTPLVSDPGFRLARAAVEAGYDVIALPGASAVLAALVGAALPSDQFTFAGFLPAKKAARQTALSNLSRAAGTLIFFESPVRLAASLEDMLAVLGDRPAAIARELTKRYEETRRGQLSGLLAGVISDPPRGEIVVLIEGQRRGDIWTGADVDKALLALLAADGGVKAASTEVAALSGWKKRDVYQRALGLKA